MADFISDFGSGLGERVIPNGDTLNRKIDFQREKFLKGISSTKHGKKEDPTYLHFKFIFDFGLSSLIDETTFLAPSPLFRSDTIPNQFDYADGLSQANPSLVKEDQLTPDKLQERIDKIQSTENGSFYTDLDFFYGAKGRIDDRAKFGFFPMNGPVAYMGAQQFLKQRSEKRKQMLEAFKRGLQFINQNCPYYFQNLSGLDSLLKKDIGGYHKKSGGPSRAGTLTVDCLESIDMRIFGLSELYRKSIYDYTNHRIMLPENLRKFRMWIIVTELRNIQLSYGINDILNPFSIPAVAQAANFLDSFNSQTGLLNNTEGLLQKSTNAEVPGTEKFGTYEMGPYAFVYQLDQCEFDFDDTFPSYSNIDNKGGTAVSTKFKIHVGRVKDYKIQFNQLADVLQKSDNIQQMVISDEYSSPNSAYDQFDYKGTEGIFPIDLTDKPNPAEFFAQMASNFITNTVADLRNQGVAIVQGAALGNIYGFGGINPAQAASSVQSLVSTIQGGIPNPFSDNTPQAKGFGGPKERQYPTLNTDVYKDNPSQPGQNLGNVITNVPGDNSLSGDVYSDNPGADLGLPDRQYPPTSGDEYAGVPGTDLGIPGRVYSEPKGDVYPDNPGADLGLPDRQYPPTSGDEYSNVPGTDLGIPGRVYQEPNDDVYPDNPGADLGLPDRQYPPTSGDEYSDVPGADLGMPGRVYPEPNGDVYSNNPGSDLGLPDRQYPASSGDEYAGVPGADLGMPGRVYSEPNGDVYPDNPGADLGLPDRQYDAPPTKDEYPGVPGTDLGVIGRIYKVPDGDIDSYNDVPGKDLGLPSRQYDAPPPKDEYPGVPGTDLGVSSRVYKVPDGDTDSYNDVPGKDLGLPDRQYDAPPPKDEYPGVPGAELGVIGRVYKVPDGDTDSYNDVPGKDLGLREREYPGVIAKEYEFTSVKDENLGRVYPKSDSTDVNRINENNLSSGDFNYNNIATASYDPVVTSKSSENENSAPINTFISDVYNSVPGSDLGLPARKYPTTAGKVYNKTEQVDIKNLGRIYRSSNS
jgi:hypothetical protein